MANNKFTNKFTVFGVQLKFENADDYTTESATDSKYNIEGVDKSFNYRGNLFYQGLLNNTTGKSDDVNIALKETSLVTVALLDWLVETATGDFKTPVQGQEGVDGFKGLVKTALDKKMLKKEDAINKGTGFLKYDTSKASWSWDPSNYQTVVPALTELINFMGNTDAGFIKRSGKNSYTIDTNTYQLAHDTLTELSKAGADTSSVGFIKKKSANTYEFDNTSYQATNSHLTELINSMDSIGHTSLTNLINNMNNNSVGLIKKTKANTYEFDNTSYQKVETSLTELINFMGNTDAGFIKRSGKNSYTIDTNTYQPHNTAFDNLKTLMNLANNEITSTHITIQSNTAGTGYIRRTGQNSYAIDTREFQVKHAAFDNLQTLMQTATPGFIRRSGANSYTIDTNKYVRVESFEDGVLKLVDA